jgi:hypothetical protein
MCRQAGLPDGIFSNQKAKTVCILRALKQKMLEYFMAIRNKLRQVGIFYGHLVI